MFHGRATSGTAGPVCFEPWIQGLFTCCLRQLTVGGHGAGTQEDLSVPSVTYFSVTGIGHGLSVPTVAMVFLILSSLCMTETEHAGMPVFMLIPCHTLFVA